MIFISAGTQLSFDRFIETIDNIAPLLDEEVIVQSIPGKFKPKNIKMITTISHDMFMEYVRRARVVVSHAGMGTIISAMYLSKPIIIFPRLASLGEHRNDHQQSTTKRFRDMGYVYVARDEKTLCSLLSNKKLKSLHTVGSYASQQLVNYVDKHISKIVEK